MTFSSFIYAIPVSFGKRESRIGFIGFTYRFGGQRSKDQDSDRQSDDTGGSTNN